MAMIVDAFAGKLVERLANVAEDSVLKVLGVKDLLQSLQETMVRIERRLKDAERTRIENETIKGWIAELKDVMYDADDIIDLCQIQGGLLQEGHSLAESASNSSPVCCNFPLLSCMRSVPFRYEIAERISNLNDRLKNISTDNDMLKLIPTTSNEVHVAGEASNCSPSCSLPDSDIVGREIIHATRSLVELIVAQDEKQYSLFAVTGMGGIGKTTLAQLIYNDPKINGNFRLRSWNWISKSFTSTADLLKEIITNTGGSSGESRTVEELQQKLSNFLQGKSVFLVLDNVWDENISTVQLCVSIVCKAANWRILITTRHQNVAEQIGKIHIHNVSELPEESGWELLCKRVFINDDEREMQRKKDIGLEIVRKCGGLPIAIKAIASVLINRNAREWKNVLNSNAWTINKLPEYLRGALYLSYQALPSALKQCFLYFSLIPSNRGFYRENLICEWIAEGLIKKDGEVSMEDVAEQHYKDFIKRSFLQIDPEFADESKCTMHDLFLSLSQYLAGGESFSGDPQEAQTATATIKLRHLAISSKREIVSLPPLDCLRSLFLWTPPSLDTRVIGNFKHLRVLVLNGDKIENIPNNIGDLVHLRLLDLKETAIRELPDSLGNLANLLFLLLTSCESLQILPASITKLSKLRQLHLDFTSLHYFPRGIGMLKDLNDLRGFILGDNGGDLEDGEGRGCNLEELKTLTNLKRLHIENLEKASKGVDVFGKDACLRELELSCLRQCDGTYYAGERHLAQIWDELLPPSSLEKLVIYGYTPSWFPKWMSSSSIASHFLNLTFLLLLNCTNCPRLPQLGLLPQLKYLKIHGATSVVSIRPEFLGDGESPYVFPELELLIFRNMTNWEEWSLGGGEDDNKSSNKPSYFPKLKKVVIDECPKLKALPRGLNQAKIFQELQLHGAHSLSRISDLPALKVLQIVECPMLECVEKLHSLKTLKLGQEPGDLPKWVDVLLEELEGDTLIVCFQW